MRGRTTTTRRQCLGLGVLAAGCAILPTSYGFVLAPLPTSRLPSPIAPSILAAPVTSHSAGLTAQSPLWRRQQQQQQQRQQRSVAPVVVQAAAIGQQDEERRQTTSKRAAAVMLKYALPFLLCTAVVVAANPAAVSAAVSAATAAGAGGGERVNKVKEYVLKPLGKALSPLTK